MSQPARRNSLVLVAPEPSRFEVHRQEAAELATLALAQALTKTAIEKASRATSLMHTACGSNAPHRLVIKDGPDGYLAALQSAYAMLGEVLKELG